MHSKALRIMRHRMFGMDKKDNCYVWEKNGEHVVEWMQIQWILFPCNPKMWHFTYDTEGSSWYLLVGCCAVSMYKYAIGYCGWYLRLLPCT